LTEERQATLRRGLDPNAPDFTLMQALYDAGFHACPASGMPILNPRVCSNRLRSAIWSTYCGIAATINDKSERAVVSKGSAGQHNLTIHD
jgi:hypothetical protein